MKYKLTSVLGILFFFFSFGTMCQGKLTKKNVSVHYLEVSKSFRNSNFDSVYYYAQKAYTNINNLKGISTDSIQKIKAQIYHHFGFYFAMSGEKDSAIYHFQNGLNIYKTLKENEGISSSYNNIGNTYYFSSDYENALKYYLLSLPLSEKENDWSGIARTTSNIGNIYEKLNQFDKALTYYKKSIKAYENIDNPLGLGNTLMNIGLIYHNKGDFEKDFEYQKEALKFFEEGGFEIEQGKALNNIGRIYEKQNNFKKALQFHLKALDIRIRNADQHGEVISNHNIGFSYIQLNNYQKAIDYLEKSLALATKINYPFMQQKNYENLALAYHQSDNHEKAYYYLEKNIAIKDSMYSEKSAELIAEMEAKYELEKKEKQNIILQQEIQQKEVQKKITFFRFLLFFVVFILLAGTFIMYRRQQNKIKYQTKINRAIHESEQKERVRLARDLHDSVGQMLSVIKMHISNLPEDQSAELKSLTTKTLNEVRNISHNLLPEALNFGLKSAVEDLASKLNISEEIKIDTEISDVIDLPKEKELSIYRIIQELIHNMVTHSGASQVKIKITRENQMVQVQFKNDGKYFDPKKIAEAKGIGWNNILARVRLLIGTIKIHSTKFNGTEIVIQIPINQKI
jgi:two-component system, NarL family, sensor kinase